MKKLIMMMAMAVGFTVFADSQNDKLISFSTSGTSYYQDGLTKVVDNECFALVWIKDGESFGGFNVDGTLKDLANNKLVRVVNLAKDGHCPPITFVIPAADVEGVYAGGSFAVYLLDTRDTNGQPTVAENNTVGHVNWFGKCDDSGSEVDAAEDVAKIFDSYVCRYADGKQVFEGERCLLVSCPAEGAFRGLDWDGTLLDKTDNAIVDTFLADANGKFSINLEGKIEAGKNYELIVLDSRIPDGSALASKLGETLVSAFGEFTLNSDGSAIEGVKWNAVKMGLSATYPVLQHAFSYDPTLILEKGYAVVSPEDGKWQVYKLPEAWVAPYESPELSLKNGTYWHLGKNKDVIPDPFKLESAYKFSAFDIQYEKKALAYLSGKTEELVPADYKLLDDWNKQVTPFKEWNADFEVSFDRPVAANSVLLAGFYNYTSAWAGKYTFDWVGEGQDDPWVGSSPEKDLAAGEVTRLLYSYIGKSGNVTMTYNEICQKVIQFFCGVKNLSEKNYGTTMTVRLCIYENTGRCHESGSKIVIGTYRYTFCGPLSITYVKNTAGDMPAGTWDVPPATNLVTDGRSLVRLGVPTYDKDNNKDIAFVGWTNGVDETIYTLVPSNTWGAITLGSVWKIAKTVQVTPNKDQPAEIKVTEEWVKDTLGVKDETIIQNPEKLAEELEKPAANGKPAWQNYLLGLDPKDADAKLKVESTDGNQEDKAIVVSTVEVAPPDTGFRVEYSLDKLKDDVTQDKDKEVDRKDTKDLVIELEPASGDTPTGYYKMNVIVTPEKSDGEPDVANQVTIPADNTIGVLRVESEEKVVPVAVPWKSLNNIGEVTVDEVVKTSTLENGDKLHVYNKEGDTYNTWTLQNGEWVNGVTVKVFKNLATKQTLAASPADKTIAQGSSVWLERQHTDKPFYLIGQYNKEDKGEVTVSAPTDDRPAYNLIAPIGIEDTDLNTVPDLKTAASKDDCAGDQIIILRDGVHNRYIPNNGKWGYNKSVIKSNGKFNVRTTEFVTDETKVTAGLGLWYIRKGTTDLPITWKPTEEK